MNFHHYQHLFAQNIQKRQ